MKKKLSARHKTVQLFVLVAFFETSKKKLHKEVIMRLRDEVALFLR
jgi:hypothetical protein